MDEKRQKWVRWTILILGTIITLAMVYGSGMRRQRDVVKAIDRERDLAQQKVRIAQRDLRYRLAVTYQLEARRQLAIALDQLDQRNFGVAQEHLNRAVELLNTDEIRQANVLDFQSATERLAKTNLTATENIGEQRTTLNTIAREMDQAFQNFIPEFLQTKLAEDRADPIKMPSLNDVPPPTQMEVGRRSRPVE
ncbi:MAG: hypothetical protein OHK0029_43110 [Armatimonadaceae bacterium]